jgi:hypothetical protein
MLQRLDEGITYAEDWNDSCNNFAEQLVKQGVYKSVACYI